MHAECKGEALHIPSRRILGIHVEINYEPEQAVWILETLPRQRQIRLGFDF